MKIDFFIGARQERGENPGRGVMQNISKNEDAHELK